MFSLLVKHEYKRLLRSNRVIWSICIFMVLFGVTFSLRLNEYNQRQQQYIDDNEMLQKEIDRSMNYSYLMIPAVIPPQLFSVFHEGLTHKYGNIIKIRMFESILRPSSFSQSYNPVHPTKSDMDITFLITFFLSLFVLLIAFDTINGEKENGTLRLMFTYPVQKFTFLIVKILTISLFSFTVLLVPTLLSVLYLIIKHSGHITSYFYVSLANYLLFAFLFVLCFALIGTICSLIFKKTAKSLVLVLAIWIFLLVLVPVGYSFFSNKINGMQKQRAMREEIGVLQKEMDSFDSSERLQDKPRDFFYWYNNSNGWRGLTNTLLYTTRAVLDYRMLRVKVFYEDYYPLMQKMENIQQELFMLMSKQERMKSVYLFASPIALFEDAAQKSSGHDIDDVINFMRDGVALRNSMLDLAIKNNWLYSDEYYAMMEPGEVCHDVNEFAAEFIKNLGHEMTQEDKSRLQQEYSDVCLAHFNSLERFDFKLPDLPKYEFKGLSAGKSLSRTFRIMLQFLMIIIVLLVVCYYLMYKFDIR